MNELCELANRTWLRLEDLLQDFDDNEKERQVFLDDTRQFFEERLSIYEKQRNEFENSIKKLSEQMYQLFDELQLPRITFDDKQLTLKEKRKYINEKIDQLKNMILQRDKEIIQLKQLINIKIKLIGNIQINIDEVRKTFLSFLYNIFYLDNLY
jgi:chromosome segregation ATPase